MTMTHIASLLLAPFRRLYGYYTTYHGHGRPLLKYIGIIGALTYLTFYLIRFTKPNPKPFDDIGLRLMVITLFTLLALRDHWPEKLRKYYLPYSYAALIVTMPFFNVYFSLERGGGVPSMSNCFIALSFLVMLTDWRNTIAMLVVGITAAASLFFSLHPGGRWPPDMLAQIPAYLIVLIGGGAFKLSEKQIDSEKSRLAAALAGSIAHEMRNPLSRISYALEKMQALLARPKVVPAGGRILETEQLDALARHLSDSEVAVRRGLQVISMTLDGVSNKPMDASSFRYLSAAEVVHKAIEEYGYDSDEDRDRVNVVVKDDFTFRGDETAYLFVLFNLVKNALFYSAAFPRTRITITVGGQQVRVHDTGPGIAPQVLKGLFEVFRSVGKAGGTGLGLAYCQRVMQAFGGSIQCTSALGEFTEFTMAFPPVSEQEREQHRLDTIAQARTALAGKRILIVEDDDLQRAMTRQKLGPIALTSELEEAPDGQSALRMLDERKFDIVLLDLRMPGLDGYAVAEKIRAGGANKDALIVAYSSEPAHLARYRATQSGMDHFVSKPCAQLPLLAALQHVTRRPFAAGATAAGRLAGRHILVADDSAFNRKAIAAHLRNAAAIVIEVEHGGAVLEQLHAQEGIHAVIVDLHMPGMDGLETARAIRSAREPWSGVPIVAMTARSDEPAVAAATAAGMNGFLVKPVDAMVLYDTLGRLMSGGSAVAQPAPVAQAAGTQGEQGLLNLQRLESYRRLGMLEELLNDYLPEMERLVVTLREAVEGADVQGSIAALHSLLGMSGEAGAQALYQHVRKLYVPLLEQGEWPTGHQWLPQLQALARRTEEALRAYCDQQTRSGTLS
ncbi:response regulator [Ramlibacter sp. USB13]|uniref:histidine kinase n=1 Tax=Ramlibacter cellulosilyticus TaxID=2764187 RepID=A0A923SDP8_9BURK|nr:response regulator [Ramlibacter cellulosilyticus]MBC5786266.1 response regulator [Ramlibacter cellulosilyticus]